MPGSLKHKVLYIGIFILMAAGVLIINFLVSGSSSIRPYSSRGSDPKGCKAFYLLLDEMGLEVSRFGIPFNRLPDDETKSILILTEPQTREMGSRDCNDLYRWVEKGNRALLLSVEQGALLETFGLEIEYDRFGKRVTRTVTDREMPLLEGVDKVNLHGYTYFTRDSGGETLIANEEKVYVIQKQVGEGDIIAVSDPDLITNECIDRLDNSILLLNAVEAFSNENFPVYFNERHHLAAMPQLDYGGEESALGELFSYMPWVWTQGLLFTVLILYVLGRRFGAPRPIIEKPASANMDFITPTAYLWQRARSRRLAVEVLYRGLWRRIKLKYHLGDNPELEELVSLAHRVTGKKKDQLERDFQRMARGAADPHLEQAEAIYLSGIIDNYRKELIR